MDGISPFARNAATADRLRATGTIAPIHSCGERIVRDRLPDSFVLERSESEWLLTLLSADELRYIFEGPTHGESKD